MAAPIPAIQVLLDDGTGTYPIDVTSRVSLSSTISVQNHGRSDEFSTATSATFTCTLKNNDGALSSTGAIAIAPGTGIRYKQTFGTHTVNRFTGKVSSLELGWDGGVAKASQVLVNAVDLLAELARRTLRSMLEQDILVDSPTAYYTCGEPEGALTAGDTSGHGVPSLTVGGSGSPVVFGSATGPADGLTAVTFSNGQYLDGVLPSGALPGTGSWSAVFAISAPTPAQSLTLATVSGDRPLGGSILLTFSVGITGLLGVASTDASLNVASSSPVANGAVHIVAVTFDGTTGRLYVDGVLQDSDVTTSAFSGPLTRLNIGNNFGVGPNFTGSISHVAFYNTALSAARVASHSGVLTGFVETTEARLSRLASYVGTTATTSSGSGQLVTAQTTQGVNALDAMETVATSEGGVLFVDGTGVPRLQGRYYRTLKVTPTLTVASKDIQADSATFPRDTQQLVNSVTVTHPNGGEQLVQDASATSAAGPGLFPESLDLIVPDDASALYAAQWLVGKHLTPLPRIGAVVVSLLHSSQAESLIQAEIGDRWALSGMPAQNWSGIGDYTVEGWSETLTVSETAAEWSMSVNLLPWSLNQAWVLGDSTYGVLGSTTILGY